MHLIIAEAAWIAVWDGVASSRASSTLSTVSSSISISSEAEAFVVLLDVARRPPSSITNATTDPSSFTRPTRVLAFASSSMSKTLEVSPLPK